MKKISIVFSILVMFHLLSCSNSSGSNGSTAGTKKEALELSSQGKVVHMNQDLFRQLVWDYKSSAKDWKFEGDLPVVVDFYADWCRPCKALAPTMDELAAQYKGKVRFYKINTDENRELSGLMQISSIPALLFVPKTEKPGFSLGALPKDRLEQMINDNLLKKK